VIAQICEEFGCTPEEALRQDLRLCMDIMAMRRYARLASRFREEGPKGLSIEDQRMLLRMEREADVRPGAQPSRGEIELLRRAFQG
jgi:hypothetical protein